MSAGVYGCRPRPGRVLSRAHRGTLFSTKWASCRRRCKPSCCGSAAGRAYRSRSLAKHPVSSSCGRQDAMRTASMCASSRRPTRISAQAVKATTFREDLQQRLAVLPIHFPSLDQRRDDVSAAVSACLNGGAITAGRSVMARLGELLLLHHWSGNVRELVNISKRMGLLGDGRALLDLDDLPDDLLRQLMNVDSPPTSPTVAPQVPIQDAPRPALVHRSRGDLERLLIEHRATVRSLQRPQARPQTICRRMDELGHPAVLARPEGASRGQRRR